MALINCPECGKENVSDTAEMCPSCGYGIKAHFEKIKEKEIYQAKLDSIKIPEYPTKENHWIWMAAVLALGTMIMFYSDESLVILAVGAIATLSMFFIRESNYKEAKRRYEWSIYDME